MKFSNVTEIAVRKMKNFILKIVSVRIMQIKLRQPDSFVKIRHRVLPVKNTENSEVIGMSKRK